MRSGVAKAVAFFGWAVIYTILFVVLWLMNGCDLDGSGGSGLDCDDQYRSQVGAELGLANAKLSAKGYESIGEDPDKLVVVKPGEKYVNGGWKAWYAQGENGLWVGGLWSTEYIMVVANPDGSIRAGRLEHEWAHEILYLNDENFTRHHTIMNQAGIPGS